MEKDLADLYIFANFALAMKKNRYVVWVHVAPYVCRYLVDNFGVQDEEIRNLVDIRRDPGLMAYLTPRLTKQSHRYDKRMAMSFAHRRSCVAVLISADKFARSGWALSRSDESGFAKLLEARCQGMLLDFLRGQYIITGSLADSIRTFYRRFHQTEETWPYDSIRKIWNRRYGQKEKEAMKSCLLRGQINENQRIFLEQMSQNGTITEKGRMTYENH